MRINNNKKWIKKISIILCSIILTVFLITLFNEYRYNKTNTGHKKGDKYLLVKYTLADKDILPEDADVGQMWSKYPNSLLTIVQDYIKLKKEGNYYIADFNYLNKDALGKVTRVDFALNNNNGITVKDATYDASSMTAKLPVGYYEKLKDQSDTVLQAQVLSLTTKKAINNVKIPYIKHNLFKDTKKELTEDIYSLSTSIPTVNMNKSKWYDREDFEIYVNGEKYITNNKNSKYYKDTAIIDIGRNPLLVNKIEVRTNKKNIFTKVADKLLGIDRVNADYIYFDDMTALGTLPSGSFDPNEIQVGYPYYFGNEYSGGSGTVISLKGDSSGVVNVPIDSSAVNPSYGFSPESVGYIVGGYNASYSRSLYGSDGTNHNAQGKKIWGSVVTGNTGNTSIYVGEVIYDGNVQSGGTWVNATRAMKLPKKVWYYTGWDTGTADWDNPTGEYDFNLYNAWSDYDGWVALFCGHVQEAQNVDETKWENWIGLTIVKIDTEKKYIVVAFSTYYRYGSQTGFGIYKFNYEEPSKYCLKVKKEDAESSAGLDQASFQLSDGQTCTTSGGTCTFYNLEKQDYTLTETSAPSGYCIDSPANVSVSSSQLTRMSGEDCPSDAIEVPKSDHKKYYCAKVKKIDSQTKELIKGAKFKATAGSLSIENFDNWDGFDDGYTTFFTGDSSAALSVVETVSPAGYEKYNGTLTATPIQMSCGLSRAEAENECKKIKCTYNSSTNRDTCKFEDGTVVPQWNNIDTMPTYPEEKLFLNWYKVTENGSTRANGAKFKVKQKNGNQYIKVNGTTQVKDKNNVTKTCYVFDSLVSEANASVLESMNTGSANGEVCISKVAKGDYTVIETKPAKYHTFGSAITKDLTTATSFKAMDDSDKFINLKTRFEFDKSVSSGDSDFWATITTQQLKHIPFNIYDSNGTKLSFVKDSSGVYQFAGNNIDGTSAGAVQDLYLNDARKFVVEHLPEGTYSVKEKGSADGSCSCVDDSGSCVGFYYPKYTQESSYKFTITDCSNESANSSVCTTHKSASQALQNVPTEIQFTKADLYGYEDASDVVDFVDDKERNDFDKIVFKLKDQNGNYMRLIKVGNHGTCLTDDSYAEYRYVPQEYIDLLPDEEKAKLTDELYTCGGHIRITHLCRNKKYYIEEVSVPDNSVFTLPENPEDRIREYNIPCCGDTTTPPTSKTVIVDKGTRVRFEKRDSKYNYLIPDETTTFEVYQCEKGTECNPADNPNHLEAANVRKLMRFSPRAIISGDQEDPTDAEGNAGVEVYNAMSDSDVKAGKTNVTELHPFKGILVLRYLPSGYNYVLLETKAPKNYTLPKGRDAQTRFTVVNNTVNVDEVDMPNVPTSLLIRKYSSDGKLLKGAQFKIYEGTTCDANLSAMNQPKKELKLKTIRDGLYEARPETDTNIIQTCDDNNGVCSSIPLDQVTKLTYTDYLGTWADFDNVVNDQNEKIQLAEGEALVQYLEYNHCYIIEEVKAPNGYSLPKKNEDRFTMITIEDNEKYAKDTYKTLVNTPTPFTFDKYDEYNNLIDGAEFKLQKLDDNKKYNDLTVTQEEKDGELYYKVDSKSTNKTIVTRNGKATVYYLEEGQYRILETKAAPGKELSKHANVATFFVDDSGNVYGNAIISNKPKTEKLEIKSSSSAEFIIGPRTGTTVIRYGLIIAIIVAAISGLMILQRKKR